MPGGEPTEFWGVVEPTDVERFWPKLPEERVLELTLRFWPKLALG